MTAETSIFDWRAERDAILAAHEAAEPGFVEQAKAFVLRELAHDQLSGEELVDRCKLAGIKPDEDRRFGAVFGGLSRERKIIKAGYCERRKGHRCAGGLIWKLNQN